MKLLVYSLFALSVFAAPVALRADTFRQFQGRNPAEIQKKAFQSGFQYPETEVECKINGYCYQKWGKSR